MNNNLKQDSSIVQLAGSKEWADFFQSFSQTSGFEFSVYNGDDNLIFFTKEPPLCSYIRSAGHEAMNCTGSCVRLPEGLNGTGNSPAYICEADVLSFSFSFQAGEETGLIVGRAGLASYDALVNFLKTVKEHELPEINFNMPFDFPGDEYLKTVAHHLSLAVECMAGGSFEKYEIEEKLLRMTSLFDRKTFKTLSRNPELMYRYILDTIGFVFGRTSAVFMVPDRKGSVYKSVYATGAHRDMGMEVRMDAENPVIKQLSDSGAPLYYERADEFNMAETFGDLRHFHFYPLFSGGLMQGVIGIFGREFMREDQKIMNAFNDYIQLSIENYSLNMVVQRTKAADEKLAVILEFSDTVPSLLDMEGLSNAMLDKALQLLDAEQGSLMFLDENQTELIIEAKKDRYDKVWEKMRVKKEGCIADMVFRTGESLLVEDIEKDPRVGRQNSPRYRTKSFVCVPIKIEDKVAGVLNLSDKTKTASFSPEDLRLIQSFINNIAIVIERNLLHKKSEDLEKLSITDPLTGMYNRRYLNARLSEEITRYSRYRNPFSFMMLDLDKFKLFNDTYGHLAGDELIKDLAGLLDTSLRTIDIAARFGGDEFVAIFPQTTKHDAIQIINRIKDKIDSAINNGHGDVRVSVSMGLATFPDDASSITELIEKTDQALYLAKKGGGNRIVYL